MHYYEFWKGTREIYNIHVCTPKIIIIIEVFFFISKNHIWNRTQTNKKKMNQNRMEYKW